MNTKVPSFANGIMIVIRQNNTTVCNRDISTMRVPVSLKELEYKNTIMCKTAQTLVNDDIKEN
jgi:hypothetical protein